MYFTTLKHEILGEDEEEKSQSSSSPASDATSEIVDEKNKANNNNNNDINNDLVDPLFSDAELSSDLSNINLDDVNELDRFDMMIQSSSPFQHPRSSQTYGGHGANTYRQSYHHQVCIK